MPINKSSFLKSIKQGLSLKGAASTLRNYKGKKTSDIKSNINIKKLMTRVGIPSGPNYTKRFKHANTLFNKGKARQAREYLIAEGKKIKELNK